MTWPWPSANTWISMWRGAATYFSIRTRLEPNADAASRIAPSSAASNSAFLSTRRSPRPPPAAAGRRLDQHRITDLVSFLFEEFRVLPFAVIARHHGHAGLFHQGLGAVFDPHGAHGRGGWPDKCDAGLVAGVDEVGVLGEKPVARMHPFRAGLPRHLDDPF